MSLSPFALLRTRTTHRAATPAKAAHVPGMKQATTTRRRSTRGHRTTLSGVATILGTLMLLGLAPAGAFAAGADSAAGSDTVTAAGRVSAPEAGSGVVGAGDDSTFIAASFFEGNQRRCWWHSWRSHRMTSPAPGDREPPTTPCASLPTSSAA